MFDCGKQIRNYHDKRVALGKAQQDELRDARKTNQDRLKLALKNAKQPAPKKFIKQGSYAMKSMVQRPNKDYDIDDGVVFAYDDLEDKTADDAKQLVCEALQHSGFQKKPKVLKNCVRVFYAEGFHVDVPVYREATSGNGFELASSDWKTSDPEGVTEWFEQCLDDKQSDLDDGRQLRRMVRCLKAFSTSRSTWRLPSGFIITVLANECYNQFDEHEDNALYDLMLSIKNRLWSNTQVEHPTLSESLSAGHEEEIQALREKLEWALRELQVLHETNCTKLKALRAWREVFDTDFFDEEIEEEIKNSSVRTFNVISSEPKSPVDKHGGGRYGKEFCS